MKKYINCKKYDEKNIKQEFYNIFSVEIEEYRQGETLKENWESLIRKVFGRQMQGDSENKIESFMWLVSCLANGEMRDDIVRDTDERSKKREEAINELENIVSYMENMPMDYYLIESDVFMNAYLSIKYIEASKHKLDNLDRKGIMMIDKDGIVKLKNITFRTPFKDLMEENDFCLNYQRRFLGRDNIQIFATGNKKKKICNKAENDENLEKDELLETEIPEHVVDIQKIKDFCGYKQRIKVDFHNEWRCNAWNRNKILMAERELQKMEDKILYYKTINGNLPRNMVDLMMISKSQMNAFDYLYLLDWLCTCSSIKWKNIIGIITVFSCIYKDTLKVVGLLRRVQLCIDLWISSIKTINRRMKCLSNALVYMAYGNDNIDYIKNMCQKDINELKQFSPVCKKIYNDAAEKYCEEIWSSLPEKLVVNKKQIESPTEYWCIYAVFQWRIVDNLRSDRAKKINAAWYSMGELVYCFASLSNKIENTEKFNERILFYIGENNLIKEIGGIKQLIDISSEILASFSELKQEEESEKDFFQMLNNSEESIRKLFCRKLREKSNKKVDTDSSELKELRKYMRRVIDFVDDKINFLPR